MGQVKFGMAFYCEVGEQFARQAAEFEAMSGAGTGDDDVGVIGMMVDDKVVVRGIGIHAYGGSFENRVDGEVRRGEGFYFGYFLVGDVVAKLIWCYWPAAVVPGELLEAVDAEDLFAGAGEVVEGGAAVGSQADYDDVVRFGGIQRWEGTMLLDAIAFFLDRISFFIFLTRARGTSTREAIFSGENSVFARKTLTLFSFPSFRPSSLPSSYLHSATCSKISIVSFFSAISSISLLKIRLFSGFSNWT
jgi:hypothetical protein